VSGFQFCRLLVDTKYQLFYILVTNGAEKQWDHSKALQALDAYADFLTLKVLEKDYDDTLLLPTDIIDEVNGKSAPQKSPASSQGSALLVLNRCGERTSTRPGPTSPAWNHIPDCKYIHYKPTYALGQVVRKQRAERCVLVAWCLCPS
jgi:hypothetical protein